MPKAYDKCVNTPGTKKFTKKLSGGKYVRGCKYPGSKTAIWGHVKEKEEKPRMAAG